MRAYLRKEDGTLEIRKITRTLEPGILTDGHGIINLADQIGSTTLRGWPDDGVLGGIYRSDLGWEYVIPHPLASDDTKHPVKCRNCGRDVDVTAYESLFGTFPESSALCDACYDHLHRVSIHQAMEAEAEARRRREADPYGQVFPQ